MDEANNSSPLSPMPPSIYNIDDNGEWVLGPSVQPQQPTNSAQTQIGAADTTPQQSSPSSTDNWVVTSSTNNLPPDDDEWEVTSSAFNLTNSPDSDTDRAGFRQIFMQRALNGLVQDFALEPIHHPQQSLTQFINAMMVRIRPDLKAVLNLYRGFTFWISVQVRYQHPAKTTNDMKPVYLHSGKRRVMNATELEETLEDIRQTILIRNSNFNRASSGLVLDDILGFRLKICEYRPLAGRCHRELPKFLKKKHCILNIINEDNRCFG